MPIIEGRTSWGDSLSALKVRNFRLFTTSNVIAMSAGWMQRIAQDWLVLQLSGSVTAVGVTVALQFAPMLFFGLWGGLIVDRYSKRMLLMLTQTVVGLSSVVLAVLALTGAVQVWHVWLIALIVGFVTVVDNPTRQVFVNELVGPRKLRNAISLNSAVFQLGGLIGPAVSGVLIVAVGSGWAFGVNALACALTVFTLSRLRVSELVKMTPVARAKGQLRQGLQYAAGKPVILWTIVMVGVLSVFALTMPVILTAYATTVFGVGATGYGLFNTLVALGALTGAIASTRRRRVRLRTVVIAGGAWGLLQAVASFMPGEASFAVLLVALGIANLLFITAANSLVQMSSNLGLRGRVMSIYVLLLLGGQAVGGPLMGWIVESLGPQTGMLISGVVPTAVALGVCIVIARRARLQVRVSVHWHDGFVRIVKRECGGATA